MKFHPWNLKLCYTRLKFQGQKPKPMVEIPHDFFFDHPWKFQLLLTDPWNFHSLFFNTAGNSMSLFLCLDYFWNNPLTNKETR